MDRPELPQRADLQRNEQSALRWSLAWAALTGVASLGFFMVMKMALVPVQASVSISTVVAVLAGGAVLLSYGVVYWHEYRPQSAEQRWGFIDSVALWRDTVGLAVAHGLITGVIALMVGYVFSLAFKGLGLDYVSAGLVVAAGVGVSVYAAVNLAKTVDAGKIIGVLAFVLIGGTLFSMITNNNDDWWQRNFSWLGSESSSNASIFNLTLIFGAIIMLTLASFVFKVLEQHISTDKTHWSVMARASLIKLLFIGVAVCLAGVGLFPYKDNSLNGTLHNWSAFGLIAIIVLLIGLLRWLAKGFSGEFYTISYLVAVSLLAGYWLYYYVGYFSLTAFELISFVIGFSWLILFLRQISLFSSERRVQQE